jgi:hypothetical protein
LKEWQEKCPELFKKKVYNLTGLDSYSKSEIDKVCEEALKDPMCCCEEENYKFSLLSLAWKYRSTSYEWKKADVCRFWQNSNNTYKSNQKCVENSRCGR